MKKLALAFASLALLATPVLACPHSDSAETTKTADKAKEAPKKEDTSKTAKPAEKTTEKKPEKVSQK